MGKFQLGKRGNLKCCGKGIARGYYETNCQALKNYFTQKMEDDMLAVKDGIGLIKQETIKRHDFRYILVIVY